MFLTHITTPHELPDYEIHQHIHWQFKDKQRVFLHRRISATKSIVLSIVPPRSPYKELKIENIRPRNPLSFAADLSITVCKNGKRFDLQSPEDRRIWLSRKMEGKANLLFCRFESRWTNLGNGCKRLVATATGVLEVSDASEFSLMLQSGIGREKHNGCGLIYLPELMS